jgi:hypothetical protein
VRSPIHNYLVDTMSVFVVAFVVYIFMKNLASGIVRVFVCMCSPVTTTEPADRFLGNFYDDDAIRCHPTYVILSNCHRQYQYGEPCRFLIRKRH